MSESPTVKPSTEAPPPPQQSMRSRRKLFFILLAVWAIWMLSLVVMNLTT